MSETEQQEIPAAAPFPRSPGVVSTDWVTHRLRAAGLLGAGDSVRDVSARSLSEGVGMMGEVTRLRLGYGPGGGPVPSVIMKSASRSETNRKVALTFRLYEREVRFYREVAAHLQGVVPACYAAEFDPGTGDYVIILADLGDYRCGDQVAGCSADDARLALDVLVRLHSTWWNRTGGAALSWIPGIATPEISSAMIGGCEAAWPQAARLFGHLISEEIHAAAPAFIAALPALYQTMSSGAQTLAHTDFRLDNFLFGTKPEHRPLVVVDWSSVLISKGVHDVAFLLTQNLTTSARRRHERELVQYYHDGLRRAGVDDYSLQQCWEDYRLAALFEFVYAILIAGMLDVSNQRATAFVSALVERSAVAITDLELLRLLAGR